MIGPDEARDEETSEFAENADNREGGGTDEISQVKPRVGYGNSTQSRHN
jgi:hypothetical protein